MSSHNQPRWKRRGRYMQLLLPNNWRKLHKGKRRRSERRMLPKRRLQIMTMKFRGEPLLNRVARNQTRRSIG